MKRALNIAIIALALLAAGWLICNVPTNSNLCRRQVSSLEKDNRALRLEAWAQDNVFAVQKTVQNVRRTRSYVGAMWVFVGSPIPWKQFGFSSESNLMVRLVGPNQNWNVSEMPDAYSSILLTQMNRQAVLVKKQAAPNFGIADAAGDLKRVSENVAVLCIDAR